MKITVYKEHTASVKTFEPGEENRFKAEMLKIKRTLHPMRTYFEVENEEKESGFTDTIEVFEDNTVEFIEYKVSDKYGIIEFQKGQPLWYKRNARLTIKILAWCVPDNTAYIIQAKDIVALKTRFVSIVGGVLA